MTMELHEADFINYFTGLVEAVSRKDQWRWSNPDATLLHLKPVKVLDYPRGTGNNALVYCIGEFDVQAYSSCVPEVFLKKLGIKEIWVTEHFEPKKCYIDITVSIAMLEWAQKQVQEDTDDIENCRAEIARLNEVIASASMKQAQLKHDLARKVDERYRTVLQSLPG